LEIGKSYLGKPIYKMSVGIGNIKVLAWSQMHGNESNGTLAMLDLLETLKKYNLRMVQQVFIFENEWRV